MDGCRDRASVGLDRCRSVSGRDSFSGDCELSFKQSAARVLLITQDIEPVSLTFEVVSAVSTVGLSLGATAQLDEVGRVVVTALMLVGRVGPVAVLSVLLPRAGVSRWSVPAERVPVG